MDKNKNRTDLLAAGRKRLQQFRQKKDNKGNTSKSSGKSSNSGHDASTNAPSEPVPKPNKVAVRERSGHDAEYHIPLSESTDDLSAKTGIFGTTELVAGTVKFPLEDSGVAETKWDNSSGDGHDDVDLSIAHGGRYSSIHPEDVDHNMSGTLDLVVPKEESTESSISLPIGFSSHPEKKHGEEQVTDEVGTSGEIQVNAGSVMQLEGESRLSSNEFDDGAGGHMVPVSGSVEVAEVTQLDTQREPDDSSSSVVAINDADDAQGRHVTQPLPDSEVISATSSEVIGLRREDLLSDSSFREKTEMVSVSGDYAEGTQVNFGDSNAERSFEFNTNVAEKSIGQKKVNLPSGSDGSLISLSQLSDILQSLDEDEFRFLFMSRELSSETLRSTDNVKVHEHFFNDAFEQIKEHLYLTSFARDAFRLQISEHQQFADEISMASTSLNEVQGKNEVLAKELAQCRSEVKELVSGREELQKQLHFSIFEVEELSAKVNELQNKLETNQGDLSILNSELLDSRNLVETLQIKNENLNQSSNLMTKEKNKLQEENEHTVLENEKMARELAQCQASLELLRSEIIDLTENLASLREERRKLEDDKEFVVHENEKLLADLSNYKRMVEALQVENKNLNDVLLSELEKRKVLEDERDFMLQENEKLSKELMDSKDLVAALQADISHLNGVLTSVTEERNKLEEKKETKFSDNENQLHESAELETSLSSPLSPLKVSRDGEILISEKAASECHADRPSQNGLKMDTYDDSFGFVVLKRHLEDAGNVMQKLEKAIEEMHVHSTSLSGSSGKVVGSGVSKLIQAFESNSHTDDDDSEDPPSSEDQTTGDLYTIAERVAQNLRALLKELILDAENASEFCRGMKETKLLAAGAGAELRSDYDSLREHGDHLEEANLELMVLYEATRELVCHAVAREDELVILCDALQKQEHALKSDNNELREKLVDFLPKISELERQFDETCQNSNEMVTSISNQIITLQKEVVERESVLEEEWSSNVAQILQKVGELDASIDPLRSSTSFAFIDNNLDVVSRVAICVDFATQLIVGLQDQLEALHKDHQALWDAYNDKHEKCNTLLRKNEMTTNTLNRLYDDLCKLVGEASGYKDETETVWSRCDSQDLSHPGVFDTLLEQLNTFLGERMKLQSAHNELNAELTNRARDIDKLEKSCLQSDAILKLVEDIEQSVRPEGIEISSDEPASRLESLIRLLITRYKEAAGSLSMSREETSSWKMQLSDLQAQIEHLNFILVQHENENIVFKQSLRSAEEDVVTLTFKLQEKAAELEQSDQRVSSIREKLSIAVTKGKGLISQRDGLKQSLAETSKELEKRSQELLVKDTRLHELETKLKAYSEAGERMEALESELSYIRNSATVLRESFLLKDSVLQRIEEILEDLELPEDFHCRDIIEKIDWLAKSVTGNSLPLPGREPRSSVGGGSYFDAEFGDVDGLKDNTKPNPNSSDDVRRRFEELQSKFYGLAEQNEMLEQSLMERNNLVQQWEEILDRVDMPSQLRSMEPDDKIQWLESALSEARNQRYSLQQKIENLETSCESLTADLVDTQRRMFELDSALQQASREKEILTTNLEILAHDYDEISEKAAGFEVNNRNLNNELSLLQEKLEQKLRFEEDVRLVEAAISRLQGLVKDVLQDSGIGDVVFGQDGIKCFEALVMKVISAFQQASRDKEILSKDLEILTHDYDEISKKAAGFEINNGNLNNELSLLQEKLEQKQGLEDDIRLVEATIRRLQDFVKDVLQDSGTEDVVFCQDGTEYFEALVMKLVEGYKTLMSGKHSNGDSADAHISEKVELTHIPRNADEQDVVVMGKKLEDCMGELIFLKQQKDECVQNNQSLVHDLEALEIKKNELQELLNQEEQKSASFREKLNVAVRKGKSLVQQRDGMKQVIEELTAEVERLKSEIKLNKNVVLEYDQRIKDLSVNQERVQDLESENMFLKDRVCYLQEKESSLSMILDTLGNIDVDLARNIGNPVEKLKEIGKHCHGLQTALGSTEQESRKSKRAAELLLAELNEVQERNDVLQEELEKASGELSELSKEKDLAEAAKHEALVHIEKLSDIHAEEKDRQLAEVTVIKSVMDQLREELFTIDNVLGDVLSKDLEVLQNTEASMKSFLELGDEPDLSDLFSSHGSIISVKPEKKVLMPEIGALKERLSNHQHLLHKEACRLSEVAKTVRTEISSQKQSLEAMKRSVEQLESIEKERGSELFTMRRNVSLIYEAFNIVIFEIENRKTHMVGNDLSLGALETKLKSLASVGGGDLTSDAHTFHEEGIRTIRDKLLLVMKDFISMQTDILEVRQKEMKETIFNLQKELQGKDIEKDRICMELVNQIKVAEAKARNHLEDLQSVRAQLHDLQKQVDVKEVEHKELEQRMKESKDLEATSEALQQKVKSLSEVLAAKEQENEAMMQALDEEEAQMENLTNRIGELERELQQKNKQLENLEVSRGKALKKLSVTVSKFDELHYLSESLLSEVEKLQSQLQERDREISFLRQEVTRCTNDALSATQMSKRRSSDEIHDFLTWLDTLITPVQVNDLGSDSMKVDQVNEYKERLQNQIVAFVTELENLRAVTQNSDMLLQEARGKVEELTRKEHHLKNSLHEKESQLTMLQGAGESGQVSSAMSDIMEVEQVTNKWTAPATIASSQVRSLRKTNSDHVAMAIDIDPSSDRLDEDDDDKAHGFKSLTTSRLVPQFTRPVTNMVDGLWMSCDRALMRQPALRLGVIIYWALLHALLATYVV
ncbi:COP1-interactive protein 1 isoform X2 [Olea europaea var. sylvestris]|uniref:COP1-interactive protein 1 isoform X2 n=1 Tax=Olea europaea var. sylvestris TaxID=158386 RepID=UPI000C1CE1AF|nr:COP1-interactive protein 1 isoform X2 [Olea europaea var. sylvestris]